MKIQNFETNFAILGSGAGGASIAYELAKKGKKVDFQKLIKELIGSRTLVKTHYYVAPLDIEVNEEKYWGHQRFLDKLRRIPKFEVVLCALKKIKSDGKNIYVVKGDDVKMSNTLIMGAVDNLGLKFICEFILFL